MSEIYKFRHCGWNAVLLRRLSEKIVKVDKGNVANA